MEEFTENYSESADGQEAGKVEEEKMFDHDDEQKKKL